MNLTNFSHPTSDSDDPEEVRFLYAGLGAGGVLLLVLFFVHLLLICVVLVRLRRIEWFIGQTNSGCTNYNARQTPESQELEHQITSTPAEVSSPDNEASKCEPTVSYEMPLYSCVQKKGNKKLPVKIEQFNDFEAMRPLDSHSEPMLNEQPNYRGIPNFTDGQPNSVAVRQAMAATLTTDGHYSVLQVNDGSPPPPLPQRQSCSLELVLDKAVERRGGGGGRGGRGGGGGGGTDPTSIRYSTLESPSLPDILYDEIDIRKTGRKGRDERGGGGRGGSQVDQQPSLTDKLYDEIDTGTPSKLGYDTRALESGSKKPMPLSNSQYETVEL